jgi:hypothetical protein
MTVLIYVDARKQVGDPTPQGLRECRRCGWWFAKNDPEGVALSTK